jgi:hypothetical protein
MSREPAMTGVWEGPLFVVGMPRSGTKLLRALLNRHPRIRIPDTETEFLPYLDRWVRERGAPVSPRAFARLCAGLGGSTYVAHRAQQHGPPSWREWRKACIGRYDVADLFESFMRCETGAQRGSGLIWGDKSPGYVRHVDLLLGHFPQARVVHLVRDVRDYCVSMRKAWGKDIRRAAWRWGTDVLSAHAQCAAQPARCIEIRYEDLIAAPEQALRTVCRFLGIEFEPGMTRLDRPVENLGDATGRSEIVNGNARKYAASLSAQELVAVESLAWDAMQALGYRAERAVGQGHLAPWSLAVRRIGDGVRLALRDVAGRGIARSVLFYWNHQRTIK